MVFIFKFSNLCEIKCNLGRTYLKSTVVIRENEWKNKIFWV
jgi:hypothetical protein